MQHAKGGQEIVRGGHSPPPKAIVMTYANADGECNGEHAKSNGQCKGKVCMQMEIIKEQNICNGTCTCNEQMPRRQCKSKMRKCKCKLQMHYHANIHGVTQRHICKVKCRTQRQHANGHAKMQRANAHVPKSQSTECPKCPYPNIESYVCVYVCPSVLTD